MIWAIVLGGAVASAIFAILKGQNPAIWFFSSAAGLPLLGVIPPAKGSVLGERKRARRAVGDKVGMVAGGAVVIVLIILAIIGVL